METVTLSLSNFENKISQNESKTVNEIFKDKETVVIETGDIALNSCYGGFSISDELSMNLDIRTSGKWNLRYDEIYGLKQHDLDEVDYSNFIVKSRSDPILIEEIKNIGLKRSSGEYGTSIYLRKVPLALLSFIVLSEYDGSERAEYDCQDAMRMLINDDTIDKNDLRQRLIELDFLGIVFKILALPI